MLDHETVTLLPAATFDCEALITAPPGVGVIEGVKVGVVVCASALPPPRNSRLETSANAQRIRHTAGARRHITYPEKTISLVPI